MIGQYYTKDSMQDFYLNNLPLARKVLARFPLLNTLFDGFKGYENKHHLKSMNAVFRRCLPHVIRGVEPADIHALALLEKYLHEFNFKSWTNRKRNHLEPHLKSDNYNQSISVVMELYVASELAARIGKDNISLYPQLSSGKVSDILVKIDGKDIYFEVGSLDESLVEKKITRILNKLAEHVGKKITDNRYLQVDVDTIHLALDMDGNIDEKTSVKKLIEEADKIAIHKLAKYRGLLMLDQLSDFISERETLEDIKNYLPQGYREYLDLLKHPVIKSWLDCGGAAIVDGTIFSSVIARKVKNLLVEIHSIEASWSPSYSKEQESFINHTIRNVKGQLGQLEKGKPNIIAVQGFDWTILGLQFHEMQPLFKKFEEFYKEERIKDLTGVVFFTDFNNHVYIPNRFASLSSRLDINELNILGITNPYYIGYNR